MDSNPIKYPIFIICFEEFRVKNRLRNRRLYRHQSYQLHHEMFLLRARLLHAVNAVNNFVLTTVCNRILKFCFFGFFYILVSYSW